MHDILQEQETEKREKFEKELRALDDWAAAAAQGGETCGWLCGEAGEGRMTLADVAYFPFLERIDATLKPFKVGHWKISMSHVMISRRLAALHFLPVGYCRVPSHVETALKRCVNMSQSGGQGEEVGNLALTVNFSKVRCGRSHRANYLVYSYVRNGLSRLQSTRMFLTSRGPSECTGLGTEGDGRTCPGSVDGEVSRERIRGRHSQGSIHVG